ncbi:cationic amino acid transporter 1-like [Spinacia oleracea]|uniref:Cationic amino acid transporter 1-like n=1 Tax=Spinacia oleracea TaxID=3562 RepID=A0ABM3R9S6_SPIOL|nr:cationic amino acid transporter 1-like [Spinacia oleracea]XP_056692375.1 cationic amino acid transporter 1-like [Spinacia oleracea]XP_056692376.1 cationic amino acid transporter 1-like [Spinacia oleracea]
MIFRSFIFDLFLWENMLGVSATRNKQLLFVLNRLTTRSLDDTELNQVKAESNHDMKKSLTWWDLTWFGIGAVIGAGIFVLTGQEANQDAGPAVILYFAVSGVSAMLSVLCYTEFAVEIPVAGFQNSKGGALYQKGVG